MLEETCLVFRVSYSSHHLTSSHRNLSIFAHLAFNICHVCVFVLHDPRALPQGRTSHRTTSRIFYLATTTTTITSSIHLILVFTCFSCRCSYYSYIRCPSHWYPSGVLFLVLPPHGCHAWVQKKSSMATKGRCAVRGVEKHEQIGWNQRIYMKDSRMAHKHGIHTDVSIHLSVRLSVHPSIYPSIQ